MKIRSKACRKPQGLFGYAFADVNPDFQRDKETLTMSITFNVAESPRVFVERIDINGNTLTQDKVVRREFRLNEGDAFNSIQVKRTAERIKSLGYFQEDLEVEQSQGSTPDRIISDDQCRGKSNGRVIAFGRFFVDRKLHFPRLDQAAQLPRARSGTADEYLLFILFEIC